jgi:carboxymethylenebutenolidase
MGTWTTLTAEDGHQLKAYVATPATPPIAALVIVQEIFGVNQSIRDVADSYAADGFLAVAPAIFDRFERDLELGYGPEDMKKAFSLYPQLDPDVTLLDIAAAYHYAAETSGKGTGVLGFCYGGLVAWLSATRGETYKMQPGCVVGYYPGGIGEVATEEPVCPVLLHFGGADSHIGKDQVEAVQAAHSADEVEIHLYPGVEHAFANHARSPYNPEAAALARQRSLAFLRANLA